MTCDSWEDVGAEGFPESEVGDRVNLPHSVSPHAWSPRWLRDSINASTEAATRTLYTTSRGHQMSSVVANESFETWLRWRRVSTAMNSATCRR